jgi:hypothetical protein
MSQARITKSQRKVLGERKKIDRVRKKLTKARQNVIRIGRRCKKIFWMLRPGCWLTFKIAEAALAGIEAGIWLGANAGLSTAIVALEIAKGLAILDPKNLGEHAKITGIGIAIAAQGTAIAGMFFAKETAKGVLELAKQAVLGFGEAAKFITSKVFDFEKIFDIKEATIKGSLREFVKKGIMPKVTLTVTTHGTTKKVSLQFNIKNPIQAIGQLGAALVRIAFTK